jgi:two-component system, OmpR family, sensor histidine kinase TctE
VKLFQREQISLFGEILDWMLTPLLVLWPASLILTWIVAQGIADKPFDRALEYNVQALAQLVSVQGNRAQFNFPAPARALLSADEDDLVYYQVLGTRGEYFAGERDIPLPAENDKITIGDIQLRDDIMRGLDVRVAYTYVRVDAPDALPLLVQMAETREKRSRLATEIITGVMLPQFLVLPLAVLLVWLALGRGIRPLHALEERIRSRRPEDMSPIDERGVPTEVAPLVASINELLGRQRQAQQSQQRFLADAAHQLKTPLAGLRMQADLALRQAESADELKQSLAQISRSSIRATNTVNQLLAWSRAESAGQNIPMQTVDLAQIVKEVVRERLPLALDKRIDLGYEGVDASSAQAAASTTHPPATQALILGQPTLLRELVRNLIDNAITYAPAGQRPVLITARVLVDGYSDVVLLHVEDNGPGIPEHEREQVLQPFYRRLGQEADGSGLGLTIVKQIAQLHCAQLSLETAHPRASAQPQDLPGIRFKLRFERVAHAALKPAAS